MEISKQTKEYMERIKDYIYSNYKFHFKKPTGGEIKYPYFSSGINYTNTVWDWGCFLASLSMNSIHDPEMEVYQKGIIYNFLEAMDETGKMPILISCTPLPPEWDVMKRNAFKPALCQHIELISEKYHDYSWVNDTIFEKLIAIFIIITPINFMRNPVFMFLRMISPLARIMIRLFFIAQKNQLALSF